MKWSILLFNINNHRIIKQIYWQSWIFLNRLSSSTIFIGVTLLRVSTETKRYAPTPLNNLQLSSLTLRRRIRRVTRQTVSQTPIRNRYYYYRCFIKIASVCVVLVTNNTRRYAVAPNIFTQRQTRLTQVQIKSVA